MLIRRCAVVWLEPREVSSFQLDDLLAGGTGVVSRLAWFAHAPHVGAPIEIEARHERGVVTGIARRAKPRCGGAGTAQGLVDDALAG